ncbi:DUF817 domain-containing protein [Bradyrhizobium sp. CB3481]|uniref:DUF817 domain-containing protein n=1 Tax=Bradyrhizobium sp. CB3481 TaxID=3039158 RepID=UPI0024B16721|nr:DUF817 domain-containing protein [Bradyrhizobium sp. CB3481]WFU16002.1 DUF817 domain-containing protein [Bradyrhizobium sp. CB3481]
MQYLPKSLPDHPQSDPSAAAIWRPLRRFIVAEYRLGRVMARRRWTSPLYEFLRFGAKQAFACLFGGIAVFLMIATWRFYPADAALPRYDFLFLCMIAVQLALLASRLETFDEAKVILIYHLVGTAMELFKTQVGSWIYPEPNFFRVGGVPLFSGFMYSCIGSYICRAWRLFDFEFTAHPRRLALAVLSLAIYVNFFSHHFIIDLRWLLFAWSILLFCRSRVHFKVWREYRTMPLLLGLFLVSLFIWFSENIGTFTKTWLYPSQRQGWELVSFGKLGSWFLLLIISYTLVSLINKPRERRGEERAARIAGKFSRTPGFQHSGS